MAKKDDKKKSGEKKKKVIKQAYTRYEISGDTLKRKNKNCPKCGKGFLLAAHKDRLTCGKCSYMEKVASN